MKGILLLVLLIGIIVGGIALAEFLSIIITMSTLVKLIYVGGAIGLIIIGRRIKNV